MNYCILDSEGVIVNIIVADADFAESIGAVPAYEGAAIGAVYDPPEPEPEPGPGDDLSARVTALENDVTAITQAVERGLAL